MPEAQSLRVLFYVQHLLGIGHLMRARRLVVALRDHGFHVTLVTGGMPLPGPELSGVQSVALPPMAVSSADFRTLVDVNGNAIDEAFRQKRCHYLLDTFHTVQPHAVIVEAFPFGRRQVRFELLPLINAIEASDPKPVLLSSIRDILQKRVKPGRDAETASLVNRHFDKVLVHGDPEFAELGSSFSHAADIVERVLYTGLVCGPEPQAATRRFHVVVSAGGGAVGAALVRTSIEASRQLPDVESWCVITGPNMPEQDFRQIVERAPANVTVERFCSDFTALLAGARLSISQAGYNTVSDILQAGCRSVLVPFSSGGETEQGDRARRLQELGLAAVVAETQLSVNTLVLAIEAAKQQASHSQSTAINTDGAGNTARLLGTLLEERA